jgi:hypothetical protein
LKSTKPVPGRNILVGLQIRNVILAVFGNMATAKTDLGQAGWMVVWTLQTAIPVLRKKGWSHMPR